MLFPKKFVEHAPPRTPETNEQLIPPGELVTVPPAAPLMETASVEVVPTIRDTVMFRGLLLATGEVMGIVAV